ncbi:unnamed protein product [Clonostachys rosea f. rosea IK726]|uniref:Alpha/beta hydrolase fold-3 domain-containing protein n=2 Tax=Bionectria ochroleuca TaxID=29856 RepID=A0A0B7KGP7_BIOOC|nr:unnamed protein product [Clonostachys rosea f. rosea IK726]
MALSVDKEFISALGSFLQSQQGVPKPFLHDVKARRARYAAIGGLEPKIPESVAFEIITIPGDGGSTLRLYHFRLREKPDTSPAVLHFHGGGFISLTPDIVIERLALIARDTGVQAFSVDYRLAPEHPYPAALNDGWSALEWIRENAQALKVNPARIAVMGESAGGGLAAAITIRARNMQLYPPISYQILCSPMLDDRTLGEVPGDFKLWDADDNLTGWTAYLGQPPGGDDVPDTAAPARVKDVAGLPKLYLDTSQFDLFVKENVDFVKRFIEAGIEVECHISPGLPHGFDGLLPSHRVSLAYEENRKRVLRLL